MNSRIEGGEMSLPNKQAVLNWIREKLEEEEIEVVEETEQYISYVGESELGDYERTIYFPKNDSADRIKQSMLYDEEVKKYVNPDAVAEFIFNCVDMNAVGAVKRVALVWDEPIFDEDGDIEDYEESETRRQLATMGGDYDEYAFEVGRDHYLGIVWEEESTVIINVSNLVFGSEKMAKVNEADGLDFDSEFNDIFKWGLVSTILHEFRHAVYEINEFTDYDKERYPFGGGVEKNVEEYGNSEADKFIYGYGIAGTSIHDKANDKAREYTAAMFRTSEPVKEQTKPKAEKQDMER